MKPDVVICEMAPRDGLQMLNRRATIPLEERVALVVALQRARLHYIEAGAFVSPRRVPAMADSAELFARLSPYAGQLAALVPNLAHFERCQAAPNVDTVALFVSASPSYSLANTRMTVDEALSAAAQVARAAVAGGYEVRAHVSGAFRDLTEANGETAAAETARVCARLRHAHAGMVIALADTDGRATEADVERVVAHLAEALGLDGIGVHLHDRDGKGLAKARAAYARGVRIFDAAVGGIGGNPTVLADAAGNVATEALVRMLEAEGARTGIDWNALIDAGAIVARMAVRVGDPPPPSEVLAAALGERESP